MFLIIGFYLTFGYFLSTQYSNFLPYKIVIKAFWTTFNIDCMAIGGFFSILLFQKSKYLKLFQNNFIFYPIIIFTLLLMLKGIYIPKFHYEFYAVLFAIIILNFSANNRIKISLEHKTFNYLGKISYGLYMYHPIGIVLALYICKSFNALTNWAIYPFSIVLTILFAGLSYKYFESFFLQYKDKFSNVTSGYRTR